MDDQDLHKLIEELHAEIQNTQSVDPKQQELLAHLESDIRELLDRNQEEAKQVHPTTLQRLQEGLDQFEVTHPTLTLAISKFLEGLSNVGI